MGSGERLEAMEAPLLVGEAEALAATWRAAAVFFAMAAARSSSSRLSAGAKKLAGGASDAFCALAGARGFRLLEAIREWFLQKLYSRHILEATT